MGRFDSLFVVRLWRGAATHSCVAAIISFHCTDVELALHYLF